MNINFKRLLYSPLGQIFISMLLGFGIATLFRKACNKRNCLVFQAASLSKIKGQIFITDALNDRIKIFNSKDYNINIISIKNGQININEKK